MNYIIRYLGISILLITLSSCLSESNTEDDNISFHPLENPAIEGSAVSFLAYPHTRLMDSSIYLSWVQPYQDSLNGLYFSVFEDTVWTAPTLITSGHNWFINWADFPSITASGNHLVAHWLQKRAEGTYDYDVHTIHSTDKGKTWDKERIVHKDGIAAEHGFVSLLPDDKWRTNAFWLDGRNTKTGDLNHDKHDHDHGHGGGAMTLRGGSFHPASDEFDEYELDDRVCDCCQTSATYAGLPVVVYRDRSEEEIRDISIVRQTSNGWTKPKTIYPDNWKIEGCPVNGPVVRASATQLGVAWYSAPNDSAQVKVIFSEDKGETFGQPVRIDDGNPVGRVDLVYLEDKKVAVSWIEALGTTAEIRLAIVDNNEVITKTTLTAISPSRKSGFPKLAKHDNDLILTWTAISEETTTVKTAIIKLN